MERRHFTKRSVFACVAFWSVLHPSAAWGAPELPDRDADVDWSVPLRAATAQSPMILEVWRKSAADPTKFVKVQVKIDNLPKFTFPAPQPFQRPLPLPGETLIQYNIRVQLLYRQWQMQQIMNNQAAWEAASKDKADKIADKINAALGASTATSTQFTNALGFKQGRVTITNALRVRHGRNSNTTGEVGDGVRLKPGSPGPSPGTQGSMGSPDGGAMIASGLDDDDNQSIVEIGIQDIYVASWFPAPGETFDEVLSGLESLLDLNGLPATFDPGLGVLSLDGSFGDADTFVWSMSDTGLDGLLGIDYGVIPEPSSLVLLGGITAMGFRRGRFFGAAGSAA